MIESQKKNEVTDRALESYAELTAQRASYLLQSSSDATVKTVASLRVSGAAKVGLEVTNTPPSSMPIIPTTPPGFRITFVLDQ